MSDGTWLEVKVVADDREKLIEHIGTEPDTEETFENGYFCHWEQSNYGSHDELRDAADEGVRFHGASGPGDDYSPIVFASREVDPTSDESPFVELLATHYGESPLLRVDKEGNPVPEDVADLKVFLERVKELDELIGNEVE